MDWAKNWSCTKEPPFIKIGKIGNTSEGKNKLNILTLKQINKITKLKANVKIVKAWVFQAEGPRFDSWWFCFLVVFALFLSLFFPLQFFPLPHFRCGYKINFNKIYSGPGRIKNQICQFRCTGAAALKMEH